MTFFQPDASSDDVSQACPICGHGQPVSSRYPAYLCESCVGTAVDNNGRSLAFGNVGMSGGFVARQMETGDVHDSHRCFVNGIECHADEARFGGIVVQPMDTRMPLIDLDSYSMRALLSAHAAVLDELQSRGILRSKNNPTGDYAEWLVSTRLGLSLETTSAKGFDAHDANGARYQIKGRRTSPKNPSTQLGVIRDLAAMDFEYLAAVVFNADWTVRLAALIPHPVVASTATYREHVRGHVMHLRKNILDGAGVRDITDLLVG